jgi:hypothetical protein
MSYPAANNMMYRLKEVDGGTEISFRHSAFGLIPEDHRGRMGEGWRSLLSRIRTRTEASVKA